MDALLCNCFLKQRTALSSSWGLDCVIEQAVKYFAQEEFQVICNKSNWKEDERSFLKSHGLLKQIQANMFGSKKAGTSGEQSKPRYKLRGRLPFDLVTVDGGGVPEESPGGGARGLQEVVYAVAC